LVMAVGSAAMHVAAITNVLSLWFDRQRGLALSLALNGASSGGIFVAPALVIAIAVAGFPAAMVGAATVMAAILIPAIAIGIDRPPIRTQATGLPHGGSRSGAGSASAPSRWTRAEALRSLAFWSVAGPFALALMAQVGFLVRQAAALFAMTQTTNAAALFIACAIFGLSAGNLVSLPALIIQREFEATSFGMVVGLSTAIGQFTYAFGPGLLGAVRDATGGY